MPTKRAGRGAAKKARSEAREERVAESLVQGKTVTQIAEEEGISRAWASGIANSAGVQQIITGLVNSRGERVRAIFDKTLDVIEDSYTARRAATFEGGVIDLGPDHYARLTGAKRFLELTLAGRVAPKEADPTEGRTMTMDQVKALLAERVQ